MTPRARKGDTSRLRRGWDFLFSGAPRPFDLLLSFGYLGLVVALIVR